MMTSSCVPQGIAESVEAGGPGAGVEQWVGCVFLLEVYTVQYIEESNIYLCFVVCRLKRGLVT